MDEPVTISLLLTGSGSCYCPKCYLIPGTALSWPSPWAPPHPDCGRGLLFISVIMSILSPVVNPGQPLLPTAVCRRQPSPGSNRRRARPAHCLTQSLLQDTGLVEALQPHLAAHPSGRSARLPQASAKEAPALHLLTEGPCHRLQAALPAVNVDCVLARHRTGVPGEWLRVSHSFLSICERPPPRPLAVSLPSSSIPRVLFLQFRCLGPFAQEVICSQRRSFPAGLLSKLTLFIWAFLVAQTVKNLPPVPETQV